MNKSGSVIAICAMLSLTGCFSSTVRLSGTPQSTPVLKAAPSFQAPVCAEAVTEVHAYPNSGFTPASGQIRGVNEAGNFCTLGSAGCYPANLNPWVRRVVNLGAALGGTPGTVGHPNARCNDGSPAVYYVQRGVEGTGSKPWRKRWIMYLHPGGACYDRDSCAGRWEGSHDSLMSYVDALATPGAGMTDGLTVGGAKYGVTTSAVAGGLRAPAFWDANHVIVEYCSSDSWSGDVGASLSPPNYVDSSAAACGAGCANNQVCCVSGGWSPNAAGSCVGAANAQLAAKACRALAPMDDTRKLHFRGRAIVKAVLDELQSGAFDGAGDEAPGTNDPDGFDKAAEFLISGTSAGGYGIYSMVDDLQDYLKIGGPGSSKTWSLPNIRLLGLADAGFFINNPTTCVGAKCDVAANGLTFYDPSLITPQEINRRSAITWSDGVSDNGGGRGDKTAYDYYLSNPASPFASIADLNERKILARAESMKMELSTKGFISTPLLIQQSQMDLNQLGWAGVQNDPQVLITAGEMDHGLLSNGSASGIYSSFNAHDTANFATTGHNRGEDSPTGCYGRTDGNPPCNQICAIGDADCLGSKQAYANYFGGQMRRRLLETDSIHWIFSRTDSWHGALGATESSSSYNTAYISDVSTWALGGIQLGSFTGDVLHFHNGAVTKDMVRTWYFAKQCQDPLRVLSQKYRYDGASKWNILPPSFPSVNSVPNIWNELNTY